MILLFLVLLLAVEAWTRTESDNSQCCYLYGSTPHNGSNCVPEGTPVSLTYFILNPHDNFTNLTVKWFKANDVSRYESTPGSEAISDSQGDYQIYVVMSTQKISDSCNIGSLYRDTFILIINNFTSDKNGYYWCQTFVNNSVFQPSQYAWFYAADSSSCMQRSYFVLAHPPHCAEIHTNGFPTPMINLAPACTDSNSSTALHPVLTTVVSVLSTNTSSKVNSLIYVIASLSAMVLIFGTSTAILLLLYIYRCYRKKAGKVSEFQEKSTTINFTDQENTLYQTLNVVEMNYESMYAKIIQKDNVQHI